MRDLERDTRTVLDLIATRLGSDLGNGSRRLVGIAGPPGSGKSTLALRVVEEVNRGGRFEAALLPMDGYHLDNAVLEARALRKVKGAPETFDAAGLVSVVRRVRQGGSDIRYPLFDRAGDCTLPDAGSLSAATPLVVIEGNYLLLRRDAWATLKALFDLTVMLAPPLAELEARLIARWRDHGLPPAEAEARARGNDLANARTVMGESAAADLFLGDTQDPEGDTP